MAIKDLHEDAQTSVKKIVDHYAMSLGPAPAALDLSGLSALITKAVTSLLVTLESSGLNDPATDATVLEAIGNLFDQIAPTISLPFVPAFIEKGLIDPILKKITLQIATGVIAAIHAALNKLNPPAPAPPAPTGTAAAVAPAIPKVVLF